MLHGKSQSSLDAKDAELSSLRAEVERLRERLRLKDDRIAWIQDIGNAIGTCKSQDNLMMVIMERITRIMDAERATIFLLEADKRSLWSRFVSNQNIQELRLDMGRGIAGWVAENLTSVNVKNAYADPRFDPSFDQLLETKTSSVLCQPMLDKRGELMGVVQVLNKREGYFSVDDESLLSALANTTSIVLDNHSLYLDALHQSSEAEDAKRLLEDRVQELKVLYNLQRELLGKDKLENVFPLIADTLLSVIDAAGVLLVLREDTGILCHARTVGGNISDVWRIPGADKPVLLQWMDESQTTRLCNTMACLPPDKLLHRVSPTIRNAAVAPIIIKEEVIGAIAMVNRSRLEGIGREAGFDSSDSRLLSLIAGQCSAAISRSIELQKAIEEDRLSTIGRMMSSVVHDMRGPLSAASGNIQLMEKSKDEDKRRDYSGKIKYQFEVLNAMILDVLEYAKGGAKITKQEVCLQNFADDIEELLYHEFQHTEIKCVLKRDVEGVGSFDRIKIRRVIFNLARNAREAMQGKGLYKVELSRRGDELLIRCQDDGPGISDELKGRIFEAFVSSGPSGGSGLGLAIVQSLVTEHGGEISFESQLGEGTTFEVRLPLSKQRDSEGDDSAAAHAVSVADPELSAV